MKWSPAPPSRPRILTALLLASTATLSVPAAAADTQQATGIDTRHWKCEYCTFLNGWNGDLSLGADGTTQGRYAFGRYNGYDRAGLHLLIDGHLLGRSADGNFFEVTATDLGLSTRSIDLRGGRQGLFQLSAGYDQIPEYLEDTATTPFLGAGSTTLTLPQGWAPAQTTGAMTSLDTSLNNVAIDQQRRRYWLGGRYAPASSHWSLDFLASNDSRRGQRLFGANFLTTSSLLPAPIHYDTEQIDSSLYYQTQTWNLGLSYYGSFFHDDADSFVWQNPFAPLASGADMGRSSLAPGNQFNELALAGSWQILPRTHLKARVATGRAEQNQAFLPPTINPDLNAPVTETNSLDGRVGTTDASISLTSSPLPRLSLYADYRLGLRDNQTPQHAYQQVDTDTFVSPETLVNLPYSFRRSTGSLRADYRLLRNLRLSIGDDYRSIQRNFQASEHNSSDQWWLASNGWLLGYAEFTLRYAHEHRTASEFITVNAGSAEENPLLRDFNMADRKRDSGRASVSINPLPTVNLTLEAEDAHDRYDESAIGLTAGTDFNYEANLAYTADADFTVYTFYDGQRISADQAGSQTFSTPDWTARRRDWVNTLGIGGQRRNIVHKLDLGADVAWSRASTAIDVVTGAPGQGFPDQTYRYGSARLFARYRMTEHLALRADYQLDRLLSDDWTRDGVNVDTIPNVLTTGVQSPHYLVNVIALRALYTF